MCRTPEYMGPEILNNLNKGMHNPEDYNVRAVDVWAAGVMLVVVLLGAFPFDHTTQHVNASDSEVDLWWIPIFLSSKHFLPPHPPPHRCDLR
jgi:serine/threonine-protein kinase SRK2